MKIFACSADRRHMGKIDNFGQKISFYILKNDIFSRFQGGSLVEFVTPLLVSTLLRCGLHPEMMVIGRKLRPPLYYRITTPKRYGYGVPYSVLLPYYFLIRYYFRIICFLDDCTFHIIITVRLPFSLLAVLHCLACYITFINKIFC